MCHSRKTEYKNNNEKFEQTVDLKKREREVLSSMKKTMKQRRRLSFLLREEEWRGGQWGASCLKQHKTLLGNLIIVLLISSMIWYQHEKKQENESKCKRYWIEFWSILFIIKFLKCKCFNHKSVPISFYLILSLFWLISDEILFQIC